MSVIYQRLRTQLNKNNPSGKNEEKNRQTRNFRFIPLLTNLTYLQPDNIMITTLYPYGHIYLIPESVQDKPIGI